MKIFLIGKKGQLGYALEARLNNLHQVFATDRKNLDLKNIYSFKNIVDKFKPELIINAAAYTDVDRAEVDRDLAFQINALAPKFLSAAAKDLDIPIIHFSTNYVFNGLKDTAYQEEDKPSPISIYGKTKWQGEVYVQNNPKHIILRTGWLFSSYGSNFLKEIIRLSQERNTLNVVNDQWGSPTPVKLVTDAIEVIISRLNSERCQEIFGTYHVTSSGKANWHEYSKKILEVLECKGVKTLLKKEYLLPVNSLQYPQKAKRPFNATMSTDKFNKTFLFDFPSWDAEIENTISSII
jgi:dTDP-4-dehydrorhamnose reductase